MNGDRYFDGEAFPEDFFPGTDGDEEHGGIDGQDEIERTFELEERNLNHRILFRTIHSLERSVRDWKLLDIKRQRKLIKEQFYFYQSLLDGEEPEDESDFDPEDEKE